MTEIETNPFPDANQGINQPSYPNDGMDGSIPGLQNGPSLIDNHVFVPEHDSSDPSKSLVPISDMQVSGSLEHQGDHADMQKLVASLTTDPVNGLQNVSFSTLGSGIPHVPDAIGEQAGSGGATGNAGGAAFSQVGTEGPNSSLSSDPALSTTIDDPNITDPAIIAMSHVTNEVIAAAHYAKDLGSASKSALGVAAGSTAPHVGIFTSVLNKIKEQIGITPPRADRS